MSEIDHVALNVHDLERSERWYTEVLGFSRLGAYAGVGFDRVLLRHVSGVLLGLSTHDHPDAEAPFSARRTGLDHLAFHVTDGKQLEAWSTRFDELGVVHSGIKQGAMPGSLLIAFRDPDEIQLEMFVHAEPPAQ